MLYQRINVADGSRIGEPDALPSFLGTGLTDAVLADISEGLGEPCATELGLSGQGFLPMTRKVTLIQFMFRLTPEERIGIRIAAASDPIAADFLGILNATPIVELDNEATIAGLGYLVTQALLTAERAAEIRA